MMVPLACSELLAALLPLASPSSSTIAGPAIKVPLPSSYSTSMSGVKSGAAGASSAAAASGSGNSGPLFKPSVGKPMIGSSAPPVSPSNTKECPPPTPPAPPAPPAPGPAAVASPSSVGSTPASIAACSFSTSVRSPSLGKVAGVSAVGDCGLELLASICSLRFRLLSRPRVSCCPLLMATAIEPAAPVTICSPAKTRSPSLSGRRVPSPATA